MTVTEFKKLNPESNTSEGAKKALAELSVPALCVLIRDCEPSALEAIRDILSVFVAFHHEPRPVVQKERSIN